jgi:hypothetical protein
MQTIDAPASRPAAYLLAEDALRYLQQKLGGYPGSAQAMRRWRVDGKGPRFVKLNARILYPVAELDAFIDSCKPVRSTQEAKHAGRRGGA